jgi:hypothetical protein
MSRIFLALRCFFGILFHSRLSEEAIASLGLARPEPRESKPAAPAAPPARASDGALQILAILQRDSRLVDFLMEDISAYSDEQVGAAVRSLHDQCRDTLARYIRLTPVIDGVENTFTSIPPGINNPSTVKFVGNVPAEPPPGGVLRHKGWRAEKVELPPLLPQQDAAVVAPAEIEIE